MRVAKLKNPPGYGGFFVKHIERSSRIYFYFLMTANLNFVKPAWLPARITGLSAS
jgi:hypothetical protein